MILSPKWNSTSRVHDKLVYFPRICRNKSVSPRRGCVTASLCVLTFRGNTAPGLIPHPWPSLLPSRLYGYDKSWVGECLSVQCHLCTQVCSVLQWEVLQDRIDNPFPILATRLLSSVLNTCLDCDNANLCACAEFEQHLLNHYFIWSFTIAVEVTKGWLEGWTQRGSWDGWVFISVSI